MLTTEEKKVRLLLPHMLLLIQMLRETSQEPVYLPNQLQEGKLIVMTDASQHTSILRKKALI